MIPLSPRWPVILVIVLWSAPALAQPLGLFTWQMAPYCNRITVTVTQNGSLFTLDGVDDQCGATTRASVVGTAFTNPDGTIGLGMSIVMTGGSPTHLDATVTLATLNGTWRDSAGGTGTFVFNGPGGGSARPLHARSAPLEIVAREFTLPELQLTGVGMLPDILSVRTGGTPAAPAAVLNGDILLALGAAGHNGSAITNPRASLQMTAQENWAVGANGTSMRFSTTPTGGTATTTRLFIAPNGNVGIGTIIPANLLDVSGDIRIGTGVTGCVLDNDATVIAGVCSSDARFKRDITPFEPVLSKVTRLQPVHFYWRHDEFPAKRFGQRESYGLVAQDVEQVLPELVVTDADGYKAVNYSQLPLLAIQAIKELTDRNIALEQRIAALEAVLVRAPER